MDTFYIMEHKPTGITNSFLVIEKRESPYHLYGEVVSSGYDIQELVENCKSNISAVTSLPDVEQEIGISKNPVGEKVISHFNDVYRNKITSDFDHSGIPFH